MAPSATNPRLVHARVFANIVQHHPELTAFRRDLHAHPEIGFEEVYTAARVQEAIYVGNATTLLLAMPERQVLKLRLPAGASVPAVGEAVGLRWAAADARVFEGAP